MQTKKHKDNLKAFKDSLALDDEFELEIKQKAAALRKISEGSEEESDGDQKDINEMINETQKLDQKITTLEKKQALNEARHYNPGGGVPLDDLDDFFGKKEKKDKKKKKEKNVGAKHFEKLNKAYNDKQNQVKQKHFEWEQQVAEAKKEQKLKEKAEREKKLLKE